MKGRATLNLSHENVIEAVQAWLDKQWTVDSPVVTEIRVHQAGYQPMVPETYSLLLESNKTFVTGEEPK